MDIQRRINDLDHRILKARERGTKGSIKAAGEMSRERSTLILQLKQASLKINKDKA